MTTTVPNMPLLDAALKHIKANPQEWDQGSWRCGTGGCLAFHIAQLSGAEWLMEIEGDPRIPNNSYRYQFDDVVTADGRITDVETYAREVAGLRRHEADLLFASPNSLEDLAGYIEALRGKANAHSTRLAAVRLSPACDTESTSPAHAADRLGSVLAG